MPGFEIEVTVREKNRLTIPSRVAERHGIEPGRRLVIMDDGGGDFFTVRVLPGTNAGALPGAYGRTRKG
jgi:AbrB family looped-hinge helix DNA binding protein